ncbi:MAG: L-aspartate oxidase [Candidatus Cyclonatronum sp.]|uniref:L-aspartate oxidase n=1 Tax=Cyclonatronum sp. TaxID=3024185 RepID=UPI0025C512F1|nr:L-aspartate oxidase [Cyclonatronum sp.]MCC5932896.1 L-aspartate oxidase [Balneolales bacterium]MCH8486625.1 L-aspartate oxidase [Cyclonatronum sp.]
MTQFDFLVIGSGSAGLSFALEVADKGTVGIITKKERAESNTNYAQGGIASVLDTADSYEKHVEDTLVAGADLCDRQVVEEIVKSGPDTIRKLIAMGAEFTKREGELHLVREGGHSHNRIIHADDMTGREIERVLLAKADEHPNITILEHHFAVELITEHHLGMKVTKYVDKTCFGAYVLDTNTDKVERVLARVTLLATGGAGQVYLHTTNPEIATGDGVAMAYRAKARVSNMEFIQFHPTSLWHPEADSFLISEAVRGHGAILRNTDGEAFMAQYDPRKELAPRDIVARAIDDQLKKRGDEYVLLDVRHLGEAELRKTFPNIFSKCLEHNMNMAADLIPIVPAAHYMCGGVWTDINGQTTINNLFAAGEVACTGLHGANRLASNSLLEALVVAEKAAKVAAGVMKRTDFRTDIPEWDDSGTFDTEEWVLVSHDKRELQQIMTDYVGIVRSDLRLMRAFRRTRLLHEEVESFYKKSKISVPVCQLRNMIAVAYLIIRSALLRKESRGLHFTTDYPNTNEVAEHHNIL